jgi:serine/threonine protein kinase
MKDIRNFKMLAKVGEGAYGTVWRAMHDASQKCYAIKVIQKSLIEKVCLPHIFLTSFIA